MGFRWVSCMASFDEVCQNHTFSNLDLWPLKNHCFNFFFKFIACGYLLDHWL